MVELLEVHSLAVLLVHGVQQQAEQIGGLVRARIVADPLRYEFGDEGVHLANRPAKADMSGRGEAQRREGEPEEGAENGVRLTECPLESLRGRPHLRAEKRLVDDPEGELAELVCHVQHRADSPVALPAIEHADGLARHIDDE